MGNPLFRLGHGFNSYFDITRGYLPMAFLSSWDITDSCDAWLWGHWRLSWWASSKLGDANALDATQSLNQFTDILMWPSCIRFFFFQRWSMGSMDEGKLMMYPDNPHRVVITPIGVSGFFSGLRDRISNLHMKWPFKERGSCSWAICSQLAQLAMAMAMRVAASTASIRA